MVEQIGYFSIGADVVEVPGAAPQGLIAQRAHNKYAPTLADFVGGGIVVDAEHPVQKDQNPYDRCWQ